MLGSLFKRLLGSRAPASTDPPGIDAQWIAETLRLQQYRSHREVVARCQAALAGQPDRADVLNLLSAALLAQGRTGDGVRHLRRAIAIDPSAQAQAQLGTVLAATGDFNGAIASYRAALALDPQSTAAWSTLAALFKALGRYDEAEDCCAAALRIKPHQAGLKHTFAAVLFEQGRVEEAISTLRESLEIQPGNSAAHSDLLRMLNYSGGLDPAAVYREHCAWDELHAARLGSDVPTHANTAAAARRLRVGYVSPYIRKHAVTFFLESVLEHYDRSRFDVVLYADVAKPDEYSLRLQEYGAAWRSTVGTNDTDLARMVRDDAIDILVDLSGHTPGNRLLAFARCPAPVQVTWNGYPNTTGMTAMDYRITDAYCDPPGTTEQLHSEQLMRLPGIYMSWRPPADAPEAWPLPALSTGHITFGSFNSCYKLTPELVALWSRILVATPESRLMLLTVEGTAAERRVRDLFAGNNLDGRRLDIRPRVTHQEFLNLHRHVDIALDSSPYHGTTTTCFSLWMGVPVVVLAGATHVSRVGVSMLTNAGLPELVAGSDNDYVEIAARLAADLPRLAALRAALRGMMRGSPNTNGLSCARSLENAYREMWAKWCGSHE